MSNIIKQYNENKRNNPFTLANLKTGMTVTLRNGIIGKVLLDTCNFFSPNHIEPINGGPLISLNNYDLQFRNTKNRDYDIVKVETHVSGTINSYEVEGRVLWREAFEITLSLEEIVCLAEQFTQCNIFIKEVEKDDSVDDSETVNTDEEVKG